ncbi:unnamed protein product [Effrenium voratum]|uniref:Uncharacterized protein n=1 Tax=Effrenium voratum TaxID=2562239 RepID=A0AA36MFP4_9DINO|nr:unnamed protein product [Effrenium voratum]
MKRQFRQHFQGPYSQQGESSALRRTWLVLEYQRRNGDVETKSIDLLNLTPETDVEVLINQIVFEEPLISENKKDTLRKMIYKLIEKIDNKDSQRFYLFKILRAHILPLTNCAFNKSGSRFITGSYDRTCRVWDTLECGVRHSLQQSVR